MHLDTETCAPRAVPDTPSTPSTATTVVLHIHRFDPLTDRAPRFDTFVVPYVKDMRLIDALNYVYETLAVDIGYRWYCGTKKCGTCAVRVNGREVLACWEAAEPEMRVEPLRHLPLVRDLCVDRQPAEDALVALDTWLVREHPYAAFPERIDSRDADRLRPTMDCISCLACYSACPVLDFKDTIPFAGPAPLVHLARVALDARDGGKRIATIVEHAHVHHCVSCYKCEEVCPAHIPIVSRAIEPLKQLAYAHSRDTSRHASAFIEIVQRRGRIEPMLLVLKTQGLAALRHPRRALRLISRGKVRPLRALLRRPIPAIAAIRQYFTKRS
jgi:succinate dehydrogenase/fumarate reductase iron-sulfur protein